MRIAVAGASGFVGRSLVAELIKDHEVIGLSRASKAPSKNLVWKSCDLFSMLDAEKALLGVDVAIYLVHSMRPSANLTQGTFDNFDLIVADNFVRAAQKVGVKQIIYLGGVRPQSEDPISDHLRSRWEVEQVFRKSSVASTVLRAAVILGGRGSSFHIMARLVQRLPVMLCPAWTKTESHPVALSDVIQSLKFCVGRTETYNKVYELGTDKPIRYIDLMNKIARKLEKRRALIPVPLLTPTLSSWWVRIVTGAPMELIKPLIQGLKTSLPMREERRLQMPGHKFKNIDEALDEALADYKGDESPVGFQGSPSGRRNVRSVQRLKLSQKVTAEEAAQAYLEYLPRSQAGLMKVIKNDRWIYFCWRFPLVRLMVLEYSPERSSSDRQLYYVRGGLLAEKTPRARLEFREILNGQALISAIHDFQPRLPWFFYRWTQALFHLWVMNQFGAFLARRNKKSQAHKN